MSLYDMLLTGWDQGCLTMKLGEIAKLTIPGELGYGAGGFPAWGYPLLTVCLVNSYRYLWCVCVSVCMYVCVSIHMYACVCM